MPLRLYAITVEFAAPDAFDAELSFAIAQALCQPATYARQSAAYSSAAAFAHADAIAPRRYAYVPSPRDARYFMLMRHYAALIAR